MRSTTAHLRIGRITASRAPKILGLSPHGGPESVMREMVREALGLDPDPISEWATEYGQRNESRAIADYEKTREVMAYRTGQWQETVVHPRHDWLAATPDGLVDVDGLVETKCPRAATYTHIDQRPDYWVQVQMQCGCLGRWFGDFAVWRAPGLPKVPPSISRVDYDPGWLNQPISATDERIRFDVLREFHLHYLRVMLDDELSAPYRLPLVDERVDPEWAEAAYEWRDANYDAKRADLAKTAAADRLIELAGGRKARGFGASVSPPGRGRINYKEVVDKYAPDADVEHFRGEAPGRATVREVAIR